jgi:hypothetical protein
MTDRLTNIKDGSFTAGDVSWLVSEVERLRAEISAIRSRLAKAMPGQTFDADSLFILLDAVLYQRRGAMIELSEIHDVLAEALGYTQDALDDPESPCPGGWVTGDHTAASLTLEAARKLKGQEATVHTLGRSVERVRDANTELAQQLEMARDRIQDLQRARRLMDETATRQIVNLQHELAESRRSRPKKRELEEIIDRQERELAARREHCTCVFRDEGVDGDRLIPRTDCPTHGVEANDQRLAGEKALNTLAYVRKYFMGSEHGHEV